MQVMEARTEPLDQVSVVFREPQPVDHDKVAVASEFECPVDEPRLAELDVKSPAALLARRPVRSPAFSLDYPINHLANARVSKPFGSKVRR